MAKKKSSGEAYAPLTARIVAALKSIARGRVASYGEVARMAGSPRAARQVVRILNTLSKKEGLPWHRVVNRNMQVSLPMEGSGALQARLLRKEGWRVDARGRLEKA